MKVKGEKRSFLLLRYFKLCSISVYALELLAVKRYNKIQPDNQIIYIIRNIGGRIKMEEAPFLMTERLILRPLRLDDSKNLMYLLHPDIQKDVGPFMPHFPNDLPKHIDRIRGDTTWLITLNQNEVIGDIGVFSKKDNVIGEMAWYLAPKYWRMGYATEAGLAVIDYMFSELNYCKLTAQIDNTNIPSCRLAKKLGFNLECIEYNSDLYGKRTDVCLYSIRNIEV